VPTLLLFRAELSLVLSRNQPSVVEIDTKRINTLRYFERLLITMLVSWRYTIPILLACSVASDAAQAGDSDPYFPKPSYFKSYLRRADTRVELQPPLHFEDYVVDGKLELSRLAISTLWGRAVFSPRVP
jgi:hypothetical protein